MWWQPESMMDDLKNALKALKAAHGSASATNGDMLAHLIEMAIRQADYEIMQEKKTQVRP
jgi:flagellar biosynthesis chaperone FliJ